MKRSAHNGLTVRCDQVSDIRISELAESEACLEGQLDGLKAQRDTAQAEKKSGVAAAEVSCWHLLDTHLTAGSGNGSTRERAQANSVVTDACGDEENGE